jgi:hypothetical protein
MRATCPAHFIFQHHLHQASLFIKYAAENHVTSIIVTALILELSFRISDKQQAATSPVMQQWKLGLEQSM